MVYKKKFAACGAFLCLHTNTVPQDSAAATDDGGRR